MHTTHARPPPPHPLTFRRGCSSAVENKGPQFGEGIVSKAVNQTFTENVWFCSHSQMKVQAAERNGAESGVSGGTSVALVEGGKS